MAIGAEHRSKFAAPSPVMVTFPYEWKILEWDEKPQTNKTLKWRYLLYISVRKFTLYRLNSFLTSIQQKPTLLVLSYFHLMYF